VLTGDVLRLPLIYQHAPIGTLLLGQRSPGEVFGPADLRLLTDLAHQIAVAAHAVQLTSDLQRSRERLVLAREEERRRLRRDLHDDLAPTLAGLALSAGTAANLTHTDPDTARTLMLDLRAAIRAAVGDIRRLVYDLRPPTLDEFGLVAAIRERAAPQQSGGMAGTAPNGDDLEVIVEAPERLPTLSAAVEVAAYRIVQEALMNVRRHAGARVCQIGLAPDDRGLHITVLDDGVGLPAAYQSGVGLRSMQERAAELGGTCAIERVAEGGTCVAVFLPVSKGV
jgi:signal transduction histidine kinase